MTAVSISVIALTWLIICVSCWLGWQLLRQNGRILLRLDELEKRLDELVFEDNPGSSRREEALTNGDAHANRFNNRSLARSRIKRDGLKAGTPAPDFRLPCLDGSERSLQDFRGKRVLLVFSDPHCGPCNALAPHLEKFHRESGVKADSPSPWPSPSGEGESARAVVVVLISRGDPKENRAKVKEHRLTFPIVLQQRWEISRLYAMFATPIAYLVDESGIITHDVSVGVEPILTLIAQTRNPIDLRISENAVVTPAKD